MDIVPAALERYAEQHSTPPPPGLDALAEETHSSLGRRSRMMVGPLEGAFLRMLVGLLHPQRVLEIGMFTGYSALSMAEALPPGGRIITCEIDETHAAIARRHIAKSPHAGRIEIRMGPAIDTLKTISGPIDFAFIDADKAGYLRYYEAVLPLLSPGGCIAADNVLWSGNVISDTDQSEDTAALRAFSARVRNDPRVECVMVPIRDGVTLIRKVG